MKNKYMIIWLSALTILLSAGFTGLVLVNRSQSYEIADLVEANMRQNLAMKWVTYAQMEGFSDKTIHDWLPAIWYSDTVANERERWMMGYTGASGSPVFAKYRDSLDGRTYYFMVGHLDDENRSYPRARIYMVTEGGMIHRTTPAYKSCQYSVAEERWESGKENSLNHIKIKTSAALTKADFLEWERL